MAAIVTFVAVVSLILGLYRVFILGPELRERRRLRERLSGVPSPRLAEAAMTHALLLPGDRVARARSTPRRVRWFHVAAARLTQLRDQSGLTIRMRVVALLMAVSAGAVMVALRAAGASVVVMAACGALGSLTPLAILLRARAARLRKFEELLPEATDVIARALRVGHTLPSALQMVGDELPDPVGAEFRLLHEHFRFGAPLPEVLALFADRVPLVDTRFLATAILLQRDTGGNLSELLDNLATVIRDRFRVHRKVRTVTAHGRLSGWILSAMPPALAAMLAIIKPDYIQTLVIDNIGLHLLAVAITLEVMGVMIIRRIMSVEY